MNNASVKDVVNSCSEEESADWVGCDSESCSGTGGVPAWNASLECSSL